VAPLVVKEGTPVGDHVLKIADLRLVDGGVVDLVQNPTGDRAPDTAGGGVRSSDAIFSAAGPTWRHSRAAGRYSLTFSLMAHKHSLPRPSGEPPKRST